MTQNDGTIESGWIPNGPERECTDPERLTYSVGEVAQVLGISKETAWKRVWDHTIPSFHVGRRVLISRRAIARIVAGETAPAGGKG